MSIYKLASISSKSVDTFSPLCHNYQVRMDLCMFLEFDGILNINGLRSDIGHREVFLLQVYFQILTNANYFVVFEIMTDTLWVFLIKCPLQFFNVVERFKLFVL